MVNQKIPKYFDIIFQAVTAVQQEKNVRFQQALVWVLATKNAGQPIDAVADVTKRTAADLTAVLDLNFVALSYADRRNILQLLALKVDVEDQLPVNEQITPDGIGYLLAELIHQTAPIKDQDLVLDFAVGSGNLLNTIKESLAKYDQHVTLMGIDRSQEQLDLATVFDELLNDTPSPLFLGDSIALEPGELAPAPIVVADLPVGYYPGPLQQDYLTAFQKGPSYAHFLMVEKALDLVTADGFVYLLVPADLLTGNQHEKILQMFAQKAQLRAFLTLPKDFFKSDQSKKALLVLQQKATGQKGQVMLGEYPSIKEPAALQEFLQDISAWGKLLRETD
ncbi:class I SAM-dependent methyltransferase [Leuconostocaceae bacterium ESL0958]|nr:class I SAM-dependent methyltransferase [Leuconostocaceae bacterium ESL0958]